MLLSGKDAAASIYQDISSRFSSLPTALLPKLIIIQVGDLPASTVYVRNKIKAVERIGFLAHAQRFPESVTFEAIRDYIYTCNQDNTVHGILLQLPLPSHLQASSRVLLECITPKKDVDGLTSYSMGQLAANPEHNTCPVPCTASAITKLLTYYNITVTGKHAVVVGASNIVGRPTALSLLAKLATVTVCHSKTQNLADHVRACDILVVAIGNPHVISSNWLHEKQIVLDIGINHNKEGKIIGDIPKEAHQVVSAITPVPGGIGPMTVACLVDNLFTLFEKSLYENRRNPT